MTSVANHRDTGSSVWGVYHQKVAGATILTEAQARVGRNTGSARIRIPLDLAPGKIEYVDIGLQLMGAPVTELEDNSIAVLRLREAVKSLLTSNIRVRYGNGKAGSAEDVKLNDLIADVIIQKARDTL